MCIELMLLAVNFNFIAFSRFLGNIDGQVFVFFILTVAAAESAIGLAILVVLFRAATQHQCRRTQHDARADGAWNRDMLLAIVLLPLVAAIIAGLFGRLIGRVGAHTVTIAAVGTSFILSSIVLKQILVDGVEPTTAPVYTWLVSDGITWRSASSSTGSPR